MRLTRQGVRDLNPLEHNGHRNHAVRYRHFFGSFFNAVRTHGIARAQTPIVVEAHEESAA